MWVGGPWTIIIYFKSCKNWWVKHPISSCCLHFLHSSNYCLVFHWCAFGPNTSILSLVLNVLSNPRETGFIRPQLLLKQPSESIIICFCLQKLEFERLKTQSHRGPDYKSNLFYVISIEIAVAPFPPSPHVHGFTYKYSKYTPCGNKTFEAALFWFVHRFEESGNPKLQLKIILSPKPNLQNNSHLLVAKDPSTYNPLISQLPHIHDDPTLHCCKKNHLMANCCPRILTPSGSYF